MNMPDGQTIEQISGAAIGVGYAPCNVADDAVFNLYKEVRILRFVAPLFRRAFADGSGRLQSHCRSRLGVSRS